MKFSFCVPTLICYDLLDECIRAVNNGTVVPEHIYVVDNGGTYENKYSNVIVVKPGHNVGCAASWNYFLMNAEGPWIISNDDIIPEEHAIEEMLKAYDENNIVGSTLLRGNLFSFFMLSQSIIDKVGYFDEKISPSYAYFEDNDYMRRCTLAGIGVVTANAVVEHKHSATLNRMPKEMKAQHNRRFELARNNYIKKWGGMPDKETLTTPRPL